MVFLLWLIFALLNPGYGYLYSRYTTENFHRKTHRCQTFKRTILHTILNQNMDFVYINILDNRKSFVQNELEDKIDFLT